MVDDLCPIIGFEVQNGDFWAIAYNEPRTDCGDELFIVVDHGAREAVHSEIDGGEIFDVGVVGEDADICAGTQTAQPVDQLYVVCLKEDEICGYLEGQRDGTHCLTIFGKIAFLVFEDALVCCGQFCLLGDLNHKGDTVLSILAA